MTAFKQKVWMPLWKQVSVQLRVSAVNITLPAFVAGRRCRRCRSISPTRRRSAANPPHAVAVVDWRDRQTDGRTEGGSTVSCDSVHFADSVTNWKELLTKVIIYDILFTLQCKMSTTVMDWVVVFALFAFMLALLCFCVATVFSGIKIYINALLYFTTKCDSKWMRPESKRLSKTEKNDQRD